MQNSIFFHNNLSRYYTKQNVKRYLQHQGFSLLLLRDAFNPLVFHVTHTYCGRNEHGFSKKAARVALRQFALENKNTKTVHLHDLPTYISEIESFAYKGDLNASNDAYRNWAWRLIPKE